MNSLLSFWSLFSVSFVSSSSSLATKCSLCINTHSKGNLTQLLYADIFKMYNFNLIFSLKSRLLYYFQ